MFKTTKSRMALAIFIGLLLAMLFCMFAPAQADDTKPMKDAVKSVLADTTQIKLALATLDSAIAHRQTEIRLFRLQKTAGNALLRQLRKLAK